LEQLDIAEFRGRSNKSAGKRPEQYRREERYDWGRCEVGRFAKAN